tara:strand:- start:15469 stop:15801 length:333 start_codon:yes stop_codon:yes gene_type:complete
MKNKTTYFVTSYLYNKAYGGHEEGGWYYSTYVPLLPEFGNFHNETYHARCYTFTSLAKARAFVDRMQSKLDYFINEHRTPVSSVNSAGIIICFVSEEFPQLEPKQKPHYE